MFNLFTSAEDIYLENKTSGEIIRWLNLQLKRPSLEVSEVELSRKLKAPFVTGYLLGFITGAFEEAGLNADKSLKRNLNSILERVSPLTMLSEELRKVHRSKGRRISWLDKNQFYSGYLIGSGDTLLLMLKYYTRGEVVLNLENFIMGRPIESYMNAYLPR